MHFKCLHYAESIKAFSFRKKSPFALKAFGPIFQCILESKFKKCKQHLNLVLPAKLGKDNVYLQFWRGKLLGQRNKN